MRRIARARQVRYSLDLEHAEWVALSKLSVQLRPGRRIALRTLIRDAIHETYPCTDPRTDPRAAASLP